MPLFSRTRRPREAAVLMWAAQVVAVLHAEFDLDETTADVITRRLARWDGIDQALEVIVDDPIANNWRLKPDRRRRYGVRLADYRMSRIGQRPSERETRVTALLAAIPTP